MAKIREVFDINLFAHMELTQLLLRWIIKVGHGSVINIASISGIDLKVGNCAYGVSKAAMIAFTKTLAAECGPLGVRVNAICPGYFYTPLTKETLDSEFFQKNAQTMIPLERYGEEGELDTAAIFLASPASTYVTGDIVPVDGGYTCM